MKEEKILKYLNRSASPNEEKEVEDWILSSGANAKRFNLLKAQYIASTFDETSKAYDVDNSFHSTMNNIRHLSAKRYQRRNTLLKYAAVVVLIFGIGYTFMSSLVNTNKDFPASDITNKDAIILQFENGLSQVIDEKSSNPVFDNLGNLVGTQNGTQLIYNKDLELEKLVYNTLTVPYGKRFDISLSDGTSIILNAGTSIKYPIKFIKGENREVYIKGEGFFDVAKDTIHPFIVHTDEFEVRVLGTQFTISSYPEDITANTILVEGSVSMYKQGDAPHSKSAVLLTPGHKAAWSRINENISIQEVDTTLYTSWINGRISFRHLPFKHIIKKLERHYNVVIINNDKELNNKLFTASFDIETIQQVLESFKKYHGINYQINDNKIIINP
jgi:hypothetical protein